MYVLVGPNGAGKSTLYENVLKPRVAAPFINADKIQKEELQDRRMEAAYEAARIAENTRRELLRDKKSFVTESTFSHPSKLQLVEDAKTAGFKIVVYHVNVRSSNLSVARVASRFEQGGHNVPEDKIRERYERNQQIIRSAVKMADRAFVYDNSALNEAPKLVASFNRGKIDRIGRSIPAWARSLYEEELKDYTSTLQHQATASYRDLKEIAGSKIKGEVTFRLPIDKNKAYQGNIIAESSLHYLQKTQENELIVHLKAAFNANLKMGASYSIRYEKKYKAMIKEIPGNARKKTKGTKK